MSGKEAMSSAMSSGPHSDPPSTILLNPLNGRGTEPLSRILCASHGESRRLATRYVRCERTDRTLQPMDPLHGLGCEIRNNPTLVGCDCWVRILSLALALRRMRLILATRARKRTAGRGLARAAKPR